MLYSIYRLRIFSEKKAQFSGHCLSGQQGVNTPKEEKERNWNRNFLLHLCMINDLLDHKSNINPGSWMINLEAVEQCAHRRKNKSISSQLTEHKTKGSNNWKISKMWCRELGDIHWHSHTMQRQQERTRFIRLIRGTIPRHHKLTSNDPNNLDSNRTIHQEAVSCLTTLPTSRLNWWESCPSVYLTLQIDDAFSHIQDQQVA